MKNLPSLVIILCLFAPFSAWPAPESTGNSLTFQNETYVEQPEREKDYVRVVEFVRPHENQDSWTKRIAIRHHPRLMTPYKTALNLGRKLQEENPGLTFHVFTCNNGTEAGIEFLARSKEGDYTEFNIYRFMQRDGYSGLISYNFSYRVNNASPEQTSLITENSREWVNALTNAAFDYRFTKAGGATVAVR